MKPTIAIFAALATLTAGTPALADCVQTFPRTKWVVTVGNNTCIVDFSPQREELEVRNDYCSAGVSLYGRIDYDADRCYVSGDLRFSFSFDDKFGRLTADVEGFLDGSGREVNGHGAYRTQGERTLKQFRMTRMTPPPEAREQN